MAAKLRDKVTASLVVAATVMFGTVIAPTAVDAKASASDELVSPALDVKFTNDVKPVVAQDTGLKADAVPADVIDNNGESATVVYNGDDAVVQVGDEGAIGLGDSEEIIIVDAEVVK